MIAVCPVGKKAASSDDFIEAVRRYGYENPKRMIIYSHKIRAADGAGGLRIILPIHTENHQSGSWPKPGADHF